MRRKLLLLGLVAACLSVFVLPESVLARGGLKVGKRQIIQADANIVDKNGNSYSGLTVNVGRKVAKGTGEHLARDFGLQELAHGPRNDSGLIERAIEQRTQIPHVPYSGGGGGYAAPQTDHPYYASTPCRPVSEYSDECDW